MSNLPPAAREAITAVAPEFAPAARALIAKAFRTLNDGLDSGDPRVRLRTAQMLTGTVLAQLQQQRGDEEAAEAKKIMGEMRDQAAADFRGESIADKLRAVAGDLATDDAPADI